MPRRRENSESKVPHSSHQHPDVRHKSAPSIPPSASASSSDEMRQHRSVKHKLRNLGRSHSSPVASSEHDIDLLSSQSNGTTKDSESKPNKTTIRVMWKNAFRSLKLKDKEKDKDREKDGDDRSEKGSERDDKKYSRMSSVKKGLLKQKDQPANTEEDPEIADEAVDPVYSLLKCAADLPRQVRTGQPHGCCLQRETDSLMVLRSTSRSSSPASVPSMTHLEVHRKTPRKLKHQRSYSTGDLSPTVEKWEATKQKPSKEKHQPKEKQSKALEPPPENKKALDKRRGWVKQKQKSKSFDFSWRVGSMWSPVEDRKSYHKEILLMESEPRCPRPKPPSMLELDSGSSYESRDVNFAKDASKQSGIQYKNAPNGVTRKEWKCPVLKENGKSLNSTDLQDSNQDRRRSLFTERKSHSLDSSMEDYHSSSQEKDDQLTDANVTYQAMAARDRRLKLQDQRRSRSLDIYDPRNDPNHIAYQRNMEEYRSKPIVKFYEDQARNISDESMQNMQRSRRASDIPARSPRRQSDVIITNQPRRSSDFAPNVNTNRRMSEQVVYQKRIPENSGKLGTGRRPGDNGEKSPRRASDISPGHPRSGTSPRRSSEVALIGGPGPSPTQSLDVSGSPGKHGDSSRDRTESVRHSSDSRRTFAQQKSFSFEVSQYPMSDAKFQEAGISVRYRTKGRMLPKVPGDRKTEGTSPGRQSDRSKEKRCHFAEQKSFSYETTFYSPAPPSGRYQHRNSEPVVFDIKRRRDYIDKHEVPLDISPHTKMHSLPPRETSGERRVLSLEQKGTERTSPRSPREKNMRQEAMDKNSAGRAATSPAAFSMSYGSMHQISPSHKQSQKGIHHNVPSPQRDSSKSPRVRKSESISIGAQDKRHHSPSDARRGHESRRKKFSEQKSFSYEVATTYQPVANDMYNTDYADVTRARTARDKRLIMMKTRASHSLDDIDFQKQMACAQGQYGTSNYDPNYRHLPPPLGYMYMGQHHLVPRVQNHSRLSPTRYETSHRGASRSPSRSPDRTRDRDVSPRSSASRAKMMMLHSMKAVAHEGAQVEHGAIKSHRSPEKHQRDPHPRTETRDKAVQKDHNGQLYDYEQGLYEDPRYLPPSNYHIGDQLFEDQPPFLPQPISADKIDKSRDNKKTKGSQEDKATDAPDFESKPVLSGPQPAVLIKPLPRDMLRKDRYSDGKPFWKFWKS